MQEAVELVHSVVLLPPVGEEGVGGRRPRLVDPLLKARDVDVAVAHAGAREALPCAVLVQQGHQVGPDGPGQVIDVHLYWGRLFSVLHKHL